MGKFVTTSDFEKGDIIISTSDASQINLKTCIDVIEATELRKLFGLELYDLFIADFDSIPANEPTAQRFIDVYNEFFEDTGCIIDYSPFISISEGIKKMLMRFIWVEFSNNQPVQPTSTGHVKGIQNNSTGVSGKFFGLTEGYNKAIDSYQAIQHKMIQDSTTYPEFKGVAKEKAGML